MPSPGNAERSSAVAQRARSLPGLVVKFAHIGRMTPGVILGMVLRRRNVGKLA